MRSVIPSPQAPISNWCLKGHAPGDLDNIISEPLRPDLILASYPTIHYVNPCLLIQGQLRAVAGDMWSPSGSDVSSANVWLNHPQGRRGCQQDTARLTSELPVTLSPSTGTHTRTAQMTNCAFKCTSKVEHCNKFNTFHENWRWQSDWKIWLWPT